MNILHIDICIPSKYGVDPSLLEILKDETSGSIHISMVEGLTRARIELIKKVKTPFFLFLDDDLIYPKGLLKKLYGFMIGGSSVYVRKYDVTFPTLPVGAVGGGVSSLGLGDKWDMALKKAMLKRPTLSAPRLFGSNMLIRTSLVRDWKPNNLDGCEDWDLTRHIRSKKYSCILIPSNTLHRRTWPKTKKNALWFGRAFPKMFKSFPRRYLLKLILVSARAMVLFPLNFRLSAYTIYQNIYIVYGMVENYFNAKRRLWR